LVFIPVKVYICPVSYADIVTTFFQRKLQVLVQTYDPGRSLTANALYRVQIYGRQVLPRLFLSLVMRCLQRQVNCNLTAQREVTCHSQLTKAAAAPARPCVCVCVCVCELSCGFVAFLHSNRSISASRAKRVAASACDKCASAPTTRSCNV